MRAVHPPLHSSRSSTFGVLSQERIERVSISDLVPTQMTVGMREVIHKRRRWRERSACEPANFLNSVRIPVVLGPGVFPYLLDRHHLALALHGEGVKELSVSIIANMSCLPRHEFWSCLESQNWARPFDARGRRCSYDEMPATLDGMKDDPFRSLSWAVKKAGGYAKNEAPFSEFRWADFFRSCIPIELVEGDFAGAQVSAMHFAGSIEAAGLPGWRASGNAMIAAPM